MNTPILLNIFNRPSTTEIVFNQLRKIRPTKLFIAADGPRDGNDFDAVNCLKTRELVSHIDWPCEVYKLFRDKNLGCDIAVPEAISWFFDNVNEGIILEDDCLGNESFFKFCDFLLNKYRNIDEVMMISGDNFQDSVKENYSYYFSKYANIWGWATWKRAWLQYHDNFLDLNSEKIKNEINLSLKTKEEQKYWFNFYKKIKIKKIENWDAKWLLSIIYCSGKCITPTVNLVKNIGFDKNSTHTKDSGHLSVDTVDILNIVSPKNEDIDYCKDRMLFKLIYKITIKKRLYQIKNIILKK